MKHCLVFDLDDTLYLERDYVLSGFHAVDSHLVEKWSAPGFYMRAEQLFLDGARGNIFDLVLADLGLECNAGTIDELVAIYRGHAPSITLLDDARWALDKYAKTLPLALITDGYAITQKQKLAALDIANYFQKVIVTDELGREFWKPSNEPYRIVEDFFDSPGESCTYVADNPSKDFITANERGWNTVRVIREQGEYQAVDESRVEYQAKCTVQSLYELPQVLKEIV